MHYILRPKAIFIEEKGLCAEDRRQISTDDTEDRAVSRHETYESGGGQKAWRF